MEYWNDGSIDGRRIKGGSGNHEQKRTAERERGKRKRRSGTKRRKAQQEHKEPDQRGEREAGDEDRGRNRRQRRTEKPKAEGDAQEKRREQRRDGPGGSRRGRWNDGILEYWKDGSIDELRMKGGVLMGESILNSKRVLAVDDEPDVLEVLEEEILGYAPNCIIEKATTYQEATNRIESQHYDVVVLDIMGVRGFDLLDQAVKRNFPAAMLTAHSLDPKSLKRSIEMGACAYLPKEKLGEIVPFLEDILESSDGLSAWGRLMNALEGYFAGRWGELWKKSEEKFWKDFEKKTARTK